MKLGCRYGAVKDIVDNSYVPAHIPDGCAPIHLNLVVIPDFAALDDFCKLEIHTVGSWLMKIVAKKEQGNILMKLLPLKLRSRRQYDCVSDCWKLSD